MEDLRKKILYFLEKANFSFLKKAIIFNLINSLLKYLEKFENPEVEVSFYFSGKRDCLLISLGTYIPFEKIKEGLEKRSGGVKLHHFYKLVDKFYIEKNGKTYLKFLFYL